MRVLLFLNTWNVSCTLCRNTKKPVCTLKTRTTTVEAEKVWGLEQGLRCVHFVWYQDMMVKDVKLSSRSSIVDAYSTIFASIFRCRFILAISYTIRWNTRHACPNSWSHVVMSAIWGYLFRLHAPCKTMHGTFCCSDKFNFQMIKLITLALKTTVFIKRVFLHLMLSDPSAQFTVLACGPFPQTNRRHLIFTRYSQCISASSSEKRLLYLWWNEEELETEQTFTTRRLIYVKRCHSICFIAYRSSFTFDFT